MCERNQLLLGSAVRAIFLGMIIPPQVGNTYNYDSRNSEFVELNSEIMGH